MAGRRALLEAVITDKGGNTLSAHDVYLYQPETTTVITQTMYTSPDTTVSTVVASGTSPKGDNTAKTLTSDSNGIIRCWFDVPGQPTHLRIKSTGVGGSQGVDQYEVVKPDPADVVMGRKAGGTITVGPVRTDIRSYGASTTATGAANVTAITNALADADEVHGPAGVFPVNATITVNGGQVLFGDAATDASDNPTHGFCLKATSAISGANGAVVTVANNGTIKDFSIDGNALATACAVTSGANANFLNMRMGGGTTWGLRIAHGQCDVYGGNYRQPTNTGSTIRVEAVDAILDHLRGTGGDIVLDVATGFAQVSNCHLTGRGAAGIESSAVLKVAGGNSQFENLYLDTGKTHIACGAVSASVYCHDCEWSNIQFVNVSATDNQPIIKLDNGTATLDRLLFENLQVISMAQGATTPSHLIQHVSGTSTNINLGKFQINTTIGAFSTSIWSNRPTFVGRGVDQGGLVTYNNGSSSIADGGTISHGLLAAPRYVNAQATVSGEFVSVTATSSTTFTCAIKKHDGTAGTTQTILWEAGV